MEALKDLMLEQLDAISQQQASLDSLFQFSNAQRQNILKAAFCGQLVPQDPDNVPASELLDRIRAERAAEASQSKPKKLRTRQANAPSS